MVEKTIPANLLPDNISDIPNDILNWAILPVETNCNLSLRDRHLQNRPFQITKPELDFYRKMNLPIPRKHPDERHLNRVSLRNSPKLCKRNCTACNSQIETTYSADRKERIYCEKCYISLLT